MTRLYYFGSVHFAISGGAGGWVKLSYYWFSSAQHGINKVCMDGTITCWEKTNPITEKEKTNQPKKKIPIQKLSDVKS